MWGFRDFFDVLESKLLTALVNLSRVLYPVHRTNTMCTNVRSLKFLRTMSRWKERWIEVSRCCVERRRTGYVLGVLENGFQITMLWLRSSSVFPLEFFKRIWWVVYKFRCTLVATQVVSFLRVVHAIIKLPPLPNWSST